MHDILSCAFKSLSRKRLRTVLTISGITVGVTMVVIVSIISSLGKLAVNTELENMGISGLSVSTGNSSCGLTMEELHAIRHLRGVQEAMPLMIEFSNAILRGTDNSTMLFGVDSGATQVISLKLKHGRLITKGDVQAALPVCVIDEALAKESYFRDNITGKRIHLQISGITEEFEIIGVTETGSSLLQNVTEFIPGMVYVPYTTLQNLTGRETFDQIAVRITADANVNRAESTIVSTLERLSGKANLYRTDNLAVQRERLSGLMDIVSLVLTAISGISLLVSGLGIMTIMLVSVNERTREIGVKKAIGASKRRILLEFLTEAVMLSLLGSVTGILVGYSACFITLSILGYSMPLSVGNPLWLIAFAVGVGVLFGVYPATKAARLRPVDALRQEN